MKFESNNSFIKVLCDPTMHTKTATTTKKLTLTRQNYIVRKIFISYFQKAKHFDACKFSGVFALFFALLLANPFGAIGQNANNEGKEPSQIVRKLNEIVDSKNQNKVLTDSLTQIKAEAVKAKDSLSQELAQKDSILQEYIREDSIFENTDAKSLAVMEDTSAFINRNQEIKQNTPKKYKRLKGEFAWDEQNAITEINAYKKLHELDSNFRVFGWHPYWMGSAYKSYNFSLLSTVAYFSYEVNPHNGDYKSIHDWEETNLVDSAHMYGTKVLLSATLFGKKDNHLFLKNIKAQKRFISQIGSLIMLKEADGVNIDFEGIGSQDSRRLTNFLIDLSTSIKKLNKDFSVTVALPAVDQHHVFDVKRLNEYIDLFIIMGYEYHGSTSGVAGPVSPIESGNTWWPFNLNTSVDEFLSKGIVPKKLLMGLPYYGSEWITSDLQFPSKVERFVKNPTYRELKRKFGTESCCVEEVSKSRFHAFRGPNNEYHQVWYEDSAALAFKYDWIKQKEIGGIGIWALGYDNGHDELWKLLAEKFAVKEEEKKAVALSMLGRIRSRIYYFALMVIRNPKSLLTNPRPLFFLTASVFGFSLMGLSMLLIWGHRFGKFINFSFKGITITLFIIMAILLLLNMDYLDVTKTLYLIGGIVLGMILLLIIGYRFVRERDLP
ncbi:glycosyl hydrolase family 18 protein [Aureibacter tunicatorum]|uniref:Spore germination protein YaaH n=1 Tax=Aureibacter tunicatorum TaxID=866807 RepID=A0AAE4BR63_9BACT|nr:glycosyl hydrolase family 18 protein [Aureibacter tunicatorum]MDR6237430.1 spore germination protein YaaH [Aureibacter tunicatorum]